MTGDQSRKALPFSPPCPTQPDRRGGVSFSTFACLVVCAVGVWIVQSGFETRARLIAVQALERCGGTVTYDYQWNSSKAWIPDAVPPGPKWVRDLLGDNFAANVVEVQLFAGPNQHPEKFTDAEAKCLASLTKVRWMVLTDTSITDSGVKHLAGLKMLERLDLERTKVTEAGVQALHQSLPKVRIYYDEGMVAPD